MFLQFFIWGSWYVTAPNFLSTIGFEAGDFADTYSVGPIAGILSPFLVGMIADRFFAAQKLLGLLHIAGGLLMYGATTQMTAEGSPETINWVFFFGYMLTYYPTLALTNTIALKQMKQPDAEFPLIRVFGTIGWIAAGLFLTQVQLDKSIGMFYVTAGAAILLGLFSFFLPDTPPQPSTSKFSWKDAVGLDAFVLLKNRSYFVFMAASFLVCIPLAFYYQIASRVVEMAGMPIGRTMSFGQMSEIAFMVLMPLFFKRLGVKWMLAVGMLAWVTRYALFAVGAPDQVRWMILGGILLHGICYDFFFVTGQIYTDRTAPKPIRAQAQGMLVLFTLGLGMLIGARAAGSVEARHTTEKSKAYAAQLVEINKQIGEEAIALASANEAEKPAIQTRIDELNTQSAETRMLELKAIDWKPLWLKPAGLALLVLLLFVLLFKEPKATGENDPA